MKSNLELFKEYYKKMVAIGDCDPAFPILKYVCNRYELNIEQRYWIAFLYGTNYSAVTTFYIYNEFPDFENVNVDRLQRWWDSNKSKLLFQTDRLKVKSFDKFVDIFKSYKQLVGDNQFKSFADLKTYEEIYNFSSNIYYFGRFSLFNYIEALHEIAGLVVTPTFIDLKEAESSRNGLCYVFEKYQYITPYSKPINYEELQNDFIILMGELDEKATIWNVETVLCAFKKLFWGKRYLGYYIDRQMAEILIMQDRVTEGVDWSVLWDFRKEYFDKKWLGEFNHWKGIRKNMMNVFKNSKIFEVNTLEI